MTIPYRGSKGALQLLVDSTGIKVEGEGEWHTRKHGGSKRRVWRKIHPGIDDETMKIRALEVTSSNVGDAPISNVGDALMLPDLLAQFSANEDIATVSANCAYDTRACYDASAVRGAAAIIPPRRNARPLKPDTAGARARNEILQASSHLDRTL